VPAVGDTLEVVIAYVFEHEAGANGEVLHGRRGPDLIRPRQLRNPRTDVYGDALDVCPDELDLAGVAPRPDAEADGPDSERDRHGAADGSGRTVGRQEPVSSRVNVAPPVLGNPAPRDIVVGGEQILPSTISELGGPACRVHDIREQHGREHLVDLWDGPLARNELLHLVEDRVRVSNEGQVVLARELNVPAPLIWSAT
jgi:hypothetical protein